MAGTTLHEIPPPSNVNKGLKNPLGLIIQVSWLLVEFIISLFRSVYQLFVPIEEKNISGQVVLITGAGRGLGRELALEFAKLGCKVACAEIQPTLNNETVELVNQISPKSCRGYYCDVGKFESCEQLKKDVLGDFGKVDILVNNAGIIAGGSILGELGEHIKAAEGIAKVNFLSHIWMIKLFLPEMVKRNSGHILCISSLSAIVGLANASLYSACKWAVTGLMESIRDEIRINNPNNKVEFSVACPYFINTSAHYVDNWECRLPNLTVSRTAKDIIKGVRQNVVLFSVPRDIYYAATFIKLAPQDIRDKFVNIFFAKIKEPKLEEVKNLPNYKIATGQMSK